MNTLLQFLLCDHKEIFGYLFIDIYYINVFSESFEPRMMVSVIPNNFSEPEGKHSASYFPSVCKRICLHSFS